MAEEGYWHPGAANPLSKEAVKSAERELQIDIMRTWFFEHYEDPAESTPYETREGGYIYIWGGPYYAREVLFDEFNDIVSEDVTEELVKELDDQSYEWSGKPGAHELDDYYSSSVISNSESHETFVKSLRNIQALLDTEVPVHVQNHFLQLLHVGVITALEAYLSDAFIGKTLKDSNLLRKFIESNPDFKKVNLTLNAIFARLEGIENEARDYLLDLVWHRMEKVMQMYKSTLGVDFPEDMTNIFKAIAVRHDLVHRNGKAKDGTKIALKKRDVEQLMETVRVFVDYVERKLSGQEDEIPLF